MEEIALNP